MEPSTLTSSGSRSDRILRIVLAALATSPFVFVPGFLYPHVVPRAAWFRALAALGLVILVWTWDRRRTPTGAWRRERVGAALAACTAVFAVAAVLGASPVEGLLGGMVRMDGAVSWVHYLAYFLLLRVALDEESWRPFLRLAALVAAAVTAWSLLQAYAGVFGLALRDWEGGRVTGTMGLEGPLSAYLLLGVSLSGYLAASASERARRIAWGALAAAQVWVLLLTGTRAALAGAVAGGLAALAWGFARGRDRAGLLRAAAWTGAATGVVLAGVAFLGGQGLAGLERILDLGPGSLASRHPMWRAAWAGFLEHPLLGVGPESFELLYDEHFRPADYLANANAHQDRAHNVLLGALAETGIAGFLAYAAFWATVLGAAAGALRRSEEEKQLVWLAAGAVGYLAYLQFWFEDLSSFLLLLTMLAFLEHRRLGGPAALRQAEERPGRRRGVGRWAAVAGAVLLLGGGLWYHAQVLGASRATRSALSAGTPAAVFDRLDRALDEHWTPETGQVTSRYVSVLTGMAEGVRRGTMEVDSGRLARAFTRARGAVEAEGTEHPGYSVPHARMGQLLRARWRWSGDPEDFQAARRELHRALEASPGRIRYLHRLARLHSQRGDAARAMEVLDEALGRFPGWWETYDTMAQVQWDAGNRERAVELLLRAARTDVRYKTAGTGTQFMVRAGSWLEARGTPMQAVELFEAYLGTRYPGWGGPPGPAVKDVPAAALPIAARLPITLMHAGRIDEAGRAARRLRERLPPHLRRPVVTDRLDRFVADMEAGRVDPWRDAWGVLPTDVPLGG